MAWYPGMEGGRAIADVLTGATEPGGRMPMVTPTDPAHLPFFHPGACHITYDRWWGQRKLDRDGHRAAFPLGFGLGYTTFALTDLEVTDAGPITSDGSGSVSVSVTAINTGARDGSTVIQLYAVSSEPRPQDRPRRQLLGFGRVKLAAGESTPGTPVWQPATAGPPGSGDARVVAGAWVLPAGSRAIQRRCARRHLRPSSAGKRRLKTEATHQAIGEFPRYADADICHPVRDGHW
jgi:beta-glucosidase